MSGKRVSVCTLLLLLLHAAGAFAQPPARPAEPESRVTQAPARRAEPGRVIVATPGDPRVTRALASMAAARRFGVVRPKREAAPFTVSRRDEDVIDPAGGGGGTVPNPTTAYGWQPYSGPFGLEEAAHLMHRALIGARWEEIAAARDQGLAPTVSQLLTPQPGPTPPGAWIHEPPPDWGNMTEQELQQLVDNYLDRQWAIIFWWVDQIVYGQSSLTEPMTLFYHDHFATGAETVFFPQAIYGQLDLFRTHALGNFKDLTRAICTDPAMLIWLNGDGNTVYEPNENFARELMELFTMGEGSGYTQQDVEEAARACTGYVTDGVDTYFIPQWHDTGAKTILGRTGNWGMDELVDIIFEQPATARYLCRKLYTWFLDDEPDDADVEELAQTLRDANYEVAPVLETMFSSFHFFDPTFRGGLVKSPLDLYAGQVRTLHAVDFDPLVPTVDYERYWVSWQMWDLGMILTNPPNVAGWPGHRNWVNTATLPLRKEYSTMIVDGTMWGEDVGFHVDAIAEAARLPDPYDPTALVDDVALLLLGAPPTPLVRERMLDALLQGSPAYAWSLDLPTADDRLRDLLRFTMRLPDYQIK